jgi:alpha-N-acetylglucosamine transferase
LYVETRRWRDCWSKLRIFDPEILPFEKVLYIDGDTILTRPIHGVFNDPATTITVVMNLMDEIKLDEAPLPAHYCFAGKPEAFTFDHPYPPDMSGDYFNVGFFVYGPSRDLYQYYMSLLNSSEKFEPTFPEQNLLNYAHRLSGNMPWRTLHYSWNMNFPNVEDLMGGAASLHVKFWENASPSEVVRCAMRWKGEMEGYWIGVNATR